MLINFSQAKTGQEWIGEDRTDRTARDGRAWQENGNGTGREWALNEGGRTKGRGVNVATWPMPKIKLRSQGESSRFGFGFGVASLLDLQINLFNSHSTWTPQREIFYNADTRWAPTQRGVKVHSTERERERRGRGTRNREQETGNRQHGEWTTKTCLGFAVGRNST